MSDTLSKCKQILEIPIYLQILVVGWHRVTPSGFSLEYLLYLQLALKSSGVLGHEDLCTIPESILEMVNTEHKHLNQVEILVK
jgi:hypothetical protein